MDFITKVALFPNAHCVALYLSTLVRTRIVHSFAVALLCMPDLTFKLESIRQRQIHRKFHLMLDVWLVTLRPVSGWLTPF